MHFFIVTIISCNPFDTNFNNNNVRPLRALVSIEGYISRDKKDNTLKIISNNKLIDGFKAVSRSSINLKKILINNKDKKLLRFLDYILY